MGDESNDPQGDSVPITVCDERSRRIEEKLESGMAGLKASLDKIELRLETIVNDHSHRLQEGQSATDKIAQTLAERQQAKDRSYKRTTLWIAVIAIAVSFFSNLDKIIAALK